MVHVPNIRIRQRSTADGRGRVYLDYVVNGKRIRENVGPDTPKMRRFAKEVAARRAYEIAEGQFFQNRTRPKITFAAFVEEYLEIHASKLRSFRRIMVIIGHLNKAFGSKRLESITAKDVEKYQTKRKGERSPATVNREVAILKSVFNKAIAWGQFFDRPSPVRGLPFLREHNRRLRYLEEDEAERLLEALNPQLRALVVFALNTGMRKGEMLGLAWGSVDLRAGFVRLKDSKSGEGRDVPLNEAAQEVLRSLPQGIPGAKVFRNTRGKPFDARSVPHAFVRACQRVGIEDFRFHDLRHTCASWLVMRGVPLETVRNILGHKSLTMTARYAHLSPDHQLQAVRVLNGKSSARRQTGGEWGR